MKKVVIGLVGEIASGKETFAKLLKGIAPDKKIAHIRFSDILKLTLKMWSLPPTRKNFTTLRIIMNNSFGEQSLPKATAQSLTQVDADIVVLDGVRWMADVDEFRQIPQSYLVYITAPVEVRFARVKSRDEKKGESTLNLEDFKRSHQTPAEKLIPEIGKMADYTIINGGTLDDFRKKIAGLYTKIWQN